MDESRHLFAQPSACAVNDDIGEFDMPGAIGPQQEAAAGLNEP